MYLCGVITRYSVLDEWARAGGPAEETLMSMFNGLNNVKQSLKQKTFLAHLPASRFCVGALFEFCIQVLFVVCVGTVGNGDEEEVFPLMILLVFYSF